MDYSRAIETEILRGTMVLHLAWVQLNFSYCIDESKFEYLLRALQLVVAYGWRQLSFGEMAGAGFVELEPGQ